MVVSILVTPSLLRSANEAVWRKPKSVATLLPRHNSVAERVVSALCHEGVITT